MTFEEAIFQRARNNLRSAMGGLEVHAEKLIPGNSEEARVLRGEFIRRMGTVQDCAADILALLDSAEDRSVGESATPYSWR